MADTRYVLAAALVIAGCASLEVGVEPTSVTGVTASSFQDGVAPTASYAGTRDTMLQGGSPDANSGTERSLSVDDDDQKEILIGWDLTAIPSSAVVDTVRVTLEVSDKSDDTFVLFEARRAWSETGATWTDAGPGQPWERAGGAGASDRGSVAVASLVANAKGPATATLDASGVALVQRWVADPSSNHGLFLAGPSTSNRLEIRSREYATKTKRPKLTVTWHDGGEVVLDPRPGTYQQSCDGSMGALIDADHFLSASDEGPGTLRLYARGSVASAVQAFDVGHALGLAASDEADLEDGARVGDRVFLTTSHGRDKNGRLERARYRFFAVDLRGAPPHVAFGFAGFTPTLLDDLLVAAHWIHPDPGVIATIAAASRLDVATDPDLAPKVHGTNIEGLAWAPTPARPGQLLIGFRNPLHSGRAIVVSLLDADAVIGGATPSFGEASLLDLQGLGIRGMTWSPVHQAVLVIAGPLDGADGPFHLYRWSGVSGEPAVWVRALTGLPAGAHPEAIVAYDHTHDVQILFDQGTQLIGGTECKSVAASRQSFTDQIVHVP